MKGSFCMKLKTVFILMFLIFFTSCTVANEKEEATLRLQEGVVLLDHALSPTGEQVAIFTNAEVYVYDLNSMQQILLWEFRDNSFSSMNSGAVAFSPDGTQLAVSGKFEEAKILILDIGSGKIVDSIDGLPREHYITEIEFSPDGEAIMVRNTNAQAGGCQGYIIDKLILYSIDTETMLFEVDQCAIGPPPKFRFAANDTFFLYIGSLTREHSISFVSSKTGEVFLAEKLDQGNDGHFYDISASGQIGLIEVFENSIYETKLVDIASREELFLTRGRITLFLNEQDYVLDRYFLPDLGWSFWEGGKLKCFYEGVAVSPVIKEDRQQNVFSIVQDDVIQVWNIRTCKIVREIIVD